MNGFWTAFLVISGVVFWVLATAVGILIAATVVTRRNEQPTTEPSVVDLAEQILRGEQ